MSANFCLPSRSMCSPAHFSSKCFCSSTSNKFNINIENEYLNKKYNNYFNNKINKLDIYLLENI